MITVTVILLDVDKQEIHISRGFDDIVTIPIRDILRVEDPAY